MSIPICVATQHVSASAAKAEAIRCWSTEHDKRTPPSLFLATTPTADWKVLALCAASKLIFTIC
ncbi:p21-activated protein kinase-interacting protein 1 [Gossypium arboreum]|uniref:p21-activated protein kinase-interacting protein 1 n=1 Tax=Gossypium arboreum TaxID=29729 RepID=A0A0B0PL20_GOSAR|nr:p21-activated protein kinase-interacting protein 1 [Gossypium arboreum]KHG25587.1 p21-activated protein kinase-interacting protein 1 [Gossypium arboreum]